MSFKVVQALKDELSRVNNKEISYMEWDYQNITDWIVSLDIGYREFRYVLKAKLKEEDVRGDMLMELDKGDLHRFGVILMKDKLRILQHIKKLTAQQTSTSYDNVYQPFLICLL